MKAEELREKLKSTLNIIVSYKINALTGKAEEFIVDYDAESQLSILREAVGMLSFPQYSDSVKEVGKRPADITYRLGSEDFKKAVLEMLGVGGK
jgi:hypothetical protein